MLTTLYRRWRYGEPVIIVSGLPRSGTSMLMNMLQAGGMPLLVDGERAADTDNPRGYFELERVKSLGEQADRSWLREARGRAVKVISHLLKELPPDNHYRVLFAVRDLGEVVRSQNTMLGRRGELNPVDDMKALDLYRRHLVNVQVLARTRPNFEFLEIGYADALAAPAGTARRIRRFVGRPLDEARMAAAVDAALYRNRGT
ncbi:MAG: sulfotransferase [Gammaproteobacteria bacterium]|nr:sulfotransferase [Gammaproteobacteria bacterium]